MKHSLSTLFVSLFFTSLMAQPLDMELLKGMKARNIGPGGMSGRVTAIDVQLENPSVIYVGTASGGLWKSENGGTNFSSIFDKERNGPSGQMATPQFLPWIWLSIQESMTW